MTSTTTQASPSFGRRLRGLALGLVAAVAFAEIACRLGARDPARDVPVTVPDGPFGVYDDELGWTACPHSRILRTHELGLRATIPATEPTARTFRLACVGDEVTWGELVDPEDVWGSQAEMHLRARLEGAVVQTVIAAGIGYSSHQDALLFERAAAPRRPDAVVLFLTTRNDRTDGAGIGDAAWWARRDRLRTSFLGKSHLVRAVRRAWSDGFSAPYRRGDVPRVSPTELEADVERMVGATRDVGGVAVAVMPPLPEDDPWRAALQRVQARLGVPAITAPPLDAAGGLWDVGGGAPKLTVAGHAVLGRMVARAVLEAASDRADALTSGAAAAAVTTVAPESIGFAREGEVTVAGSRLDEVRELYVGPARVDFERTSSGLTFQAPTWLRIHPGRRAVTAVTAAGRAGGALELVTRRPMIRWEPSDAPRESGTFSCFAPPYSKVMIWFSAERLARPIATACGPFELVGGMKPKDAWNRDVWTAIPLLGVVGHADRGGRLRLTVPAPPPDAPPPPPRGWVQALVIWGPRPDDACLSSVVEITGR